MNDNDMTVRRSRRENSLSRFHVNRKRFMNSTNNFWGATMKVIISTKIAAYKVRIIEYKVYV